MWKSPLGIAGDAGRGRKVRRLGRSQTIAGLLVGVTAVVPALASAEQTGSWTITETISPLTNGRTVSASTPSTEQLLNMLGRPETAMLVLRCREGARAAYISWPQVISAPFRSALLNLPQAQVLTKIDSGSVTSNFWVVSDDGTAAGSFDNLGAPKIIASLRGAKHLVVRMSSRSTTQDAVFDLAGVDEVVARVEGACGAKPAAPAVTPAYVDSPLVSQSIQAPPQALREAATQVLREMGFPEARKAERGVFSPMQPYKLTSRQVDCGKVLGLAYLSDNRTQTQVLPAILIAEGSASVRLSILGLEKVGMGAADKLLHCTSTGVIEHEILQRIAAKATASAAPAP